MSTTSREKLEICEELWFSKQEFEKMLNGLIGKELFSTNIVSKQESCSLKRKTFNLFGASKNEHF